MVEKLLTFAVCDDDEIVCEAICNKIGKILAKFGLSATIDKYVLPASLYKNIKGGQRSYDALFLDIDMPKLNGIELAKALQQRETYPDIIFVSNRTDMVFDTFSVRPFGFVRKNNFTNDLIDTLRAYVNTQISKNAYLAIRTSSNSVVRKIKVSDIVYIESFRYKQFINMADGEQIECHMSMEEFETKLADFDIVRVYKGYLVNLRYVRHIERTGVLLDYGDGVNINVSRDKVQELKEMYLNYLRKTGTVMIE